MQAVILAGGLATRVRPLTNDLPKALLDVNGRPFLEHQLSLLRSGGVTDAVLCVGHLAEQIESRFGDGGALGVRLRYSRDGERPLGTGGALKRAEPLLEDAFLMLDGDVFLPVDYGRLWALFAEKKPWGVMAVYRNAEGREPSNAAVESGKVTRYQRGAPGCTHVHSGASVLDKRALSLIPADEPSSQDAFWPRLLEGGRLLAFETGRPFEIGSPAGLEEFRRQFTPSSGAR